MKTVYYLEGLDCPNCAMKIEDRVNKLSGVDNATMIFVNKKLEVEYSIDKEKLDEKVKAIVNKLEPDVIVKNAGEEVKPQKVSFTPEIIRIGIAFALLVVSFITSGILSAAFAVLSYVLAGYDIVINAVRNIIRREAFDESLLMTIATVGAIAIGEFSEGAAVMVFFQIGELFQNIAVEKSRKSITSLMKIKPEYVTLVSDGEEKTVSPESVKIGDVFSVKPGERIACDGIIVKGSSALDTAAVTGESVLRDVSVNDSVISGCVNVNGKIEVECTAEYKDSCISKILQMVEDASSRKAKSEKFITKFARVYTPIVVLAALLIVILPTLVFGFDEFSQWLYRGLVFLVISCPCALVISVPLSFFAGIGGAAASGILIKGAFAIENIAKINTAAFDKTGTITKGNFAVKEIKLFDDLSEDEILKISSAIERNSTHPIARSIVDECGKKNFSEFPCVEEYTEYAGKGAGGRIGADTVIVGNEKLMREFGIEISTENSFATSVFCAVNGVLKGEIALEDEIKETSHNALKKLRNIGVKRLVMLTGDKNETAQKVASALEIDEYKSELMPQDKVEVLRSLKNDNGMVAFCGDGINDAPVLATADVGFAMGGLGSDIAIEAADAVIMNDSLEGIANAMKISKRTMSIVKQNIVFALGVKFIVMILGAFGMASMWAAVFADVGVSVIAVLNALRAMKKEE